LKVYSFRLGKKDDDIERLLEGLDRNERSSYIKEALRFYRDFGENLSRISEGVDCILKKIESSGPFPADFQEQSRDEESKENGENEKVLIDSLEDILAF
jgi:Arc/MetJ-type ribon-helix-helix transcriptional regulator